MISNCESLLSIMQIVAMYLLSVHRSLSAVHVCIKRDLPCGGITPHHKLAIASYNFTTHGYTIIIYNGQDFIHV